MNMGACGVRNPGAVASVLPLPRQDSICCRRQGGVPSSQPISVSGTHPSARASSDTPSSWRSTLRAASSTCLRKHQASGGPVGPSQSVSLKGRPCSRCCYAKRSPQALVVHIEAPFHDIVRMMAATVSHRDGGTGGLAPAWQRGDRQDRHCSDTWSKRQDDASSAGPLHNFICSGSREKAPPTEVNPGRGQSCSRVGMQQQQPHLVVDLGRGRVRTVRDRRERTRMEGAGVIPKYIRSDAHRHLKGRLGKIVAMFLHGGRTPDMQ